MAATLTKEMLQDLHRGCSAISLLSYPPDGAKYLASLSSLDFTDADQVFSIKDSFQLSPADPDTQETQIDQYDETIDYSMTEGAWEVTANLPTNSAKVLSYFFDGAEDVTGVKGQDGDSYEGMAFTNAKEVDVTMLIESESKQTAVILAHVRMMVSPPARDDNSTPMYLKLSGAVLVNGEGPKFATLTKSATA